MAMVMRHGSALPKGMTVWLQVLRCVVVAAAPPQGKEGCPRARGLQDCQVVYIFPHGYICRNIKKVHISESFHPKYIINSFQKGLCLPMTCYKANRLICIWPKGSIILAKVYTQG